MTAGQDTTISITFDASVTVSAIRIWNYNKSRAHSYRGVRWLRMTLDQQLIFDGEIIQAPGMLSLSQQCEVILYTLDERIISHVEAGCEPLAVMNDDIDLISDDQSDASAGAAVHTALHASEQQASNPSSNSSSLFLPAGGAIGCNMEGERPATGAAGRENDCKHDNGARTAERVGAIATLQHLHVCMTAFTLLTLAEYICCKSQRSQ